MVERTYRTKAETVEYFKYLARSFEIEAHRDNDNPVLYAKAEAYEIAAFEVERNMK